MSELLGLGRESVLRLLEPFECLASQRKRLAARLSIDSFAPSLHRHDLIRCCVSAIVEHEHKCVLSVTATAPGTATAAAMHAADRIGSDPITSLHRTRRVGGADLTTALRSSLPLPLSPLMRSRTAWSRVKQSHATLDQQSHSTRGGS